MTVRITFVGGSTRVLYGVLDSNIAGVNHYSFRTKDRVYVYPVRNVLELDIDGDKTDG